MTDFTIVSHKKYIKLINPLNGMLKMKLPGTGTHTLLMGM